MANYKNISKSKSEYTKIYSGFRGVELGLDGACPSYRLAYSENMYRDYSGDGDAVESVPGFRKLLSTGEAVHSLFIQRTNGDGNFLLVHAGTSLYRLPLYEQRGFASTPEPIAELGENKCRAFTSSGAIYVMNGEKILRVDDGGNVKTVGDDLGAYIPTLYHNGERYEERNLLTNEVYEEWQIYDPYRYAHGTSAIEYRITDSELRLCAAAGIDENYTGDLYVPATVSIGGIDYSVKEIADRAFYNNKNITSVIIAEGVERIGRLAFTDATGITKFVTPDSLKSIGYGALSGCVNMTELHIGAGIESCGESAFTQCYSLAAVTYPLDVETYKSVENLTTLVEIVPGVKYTKIRAEFPLKSGAVSYSDLTVDGEGKEYGLISENGVICAVTVDFDSRKELSEKKIRIKGTLPDYYSSFSGVSEDSEASVEGRSAVGKCTLFAMFDGRIFLAGSEGLPNTVFYSGRDLTGNNNPLYFPILNYFNDGVGKFGVVSMLAVRDTLAVFKSGDDGTGSIFYHVPKETGEDLLPKIYPVSYVHSGICAEGDSISFMDDPVFLCPLGLGGLDRDEIDLQRSVVCRSHNVNYDLLRENLGEASLGIWQGYLSIGVRGSIYLADSRATFTHSTGSREYEWFLLKNVGTYKNATRVYRYSSVAPDGYLVDEEEGEVCPHTAYSDVLEDETVYYCIKDGEKYALDPTEEFSGGDYYPATCFLAEGGYLIFGTECGDVCIFNNDMRGYAPERIRLDENFSQEEYEEAMGRLIHPDYYTFDDHAARYCIKTSLDNCQIPHLTKDTVKHSAVIKCRSFAGARLSIEAGTDRSGYSEVVTFPGGEMNFGDMDFSGFTTAAGNSYNLPFGEKEKRWVEKQIAIYSDRFRSPIGIYSIAYRYAVKGRIKRN